MVRYSRAILSLGVIERLTERRNTAQDGKSVRLERWGEILGWFGPLEVPHRPDGFLDRVRNIRRS